jgi:hypothetical protein
MRLNKEKRQDSRKRPGLRLNTQPKKHKIKLAKLHKKR